MSTAILEGYGDLIIHDGNTDFTIVKPTPFATNSTKVKRWWRQNYNVVTYEACAIVELLDFYIVVSCAQDVQLKMTFDGTSAVTFDVGYDKLGDGNIERILVVPKTEFHNPVNYDDYYYDYSTRELRKNSYGNGAVFDIFLTAALDLKFAESKSLVDSISGNDLVSFTRASSGTFVGADGLIKSTSVNFALNSNIVQGSPIGTSILNSTESVVSPRGITETVRRLGRDLQAGGAQVWRVGSTSGGTPDTTYTISFYAKTVSGGTTSINIDINDGAPLTGLSASITGEWTRIVKTGGSRPNNLRFFDINMVTATEDFYVWGAQIEIGTTATDYIPTTSTISGAPRFDHDFVTGESLGLLIEESRTNKIFYSQDLTTGGGNLWKLGDGGFTQNNSSFPLAPDGVSRMWLVNLDSTSGTPNNGSRIYQSGMAFGSVVNVFSFYARSVSGTGTFPAAYWNGTNYIKIYIPLTTTTTRYIIYIPANTGGSIVGFSRRGTTHDETLTQAYVWGCQCEEGNFVTSHIPTFGSQATRAADIVEITGTNFSSFYNETEGSLFASFSSPIQTNNSSNDYDILTFINNNDSNRKLQFFVDLNASPLPKLGLRIRNGQGVQRTATLTETKPFLNFKSAASFGPNLTGIANANDPRFATNNVLQTTSSGSTIIGLPGFTKLTIGSRPDGGGRSINGHFKRVAYFATRLPDEKVQSITS